MSEKVDCVVVGAGVIGLAIARSLAKKGREVIVLEAENDIGTGTSSRNSEVIHAGIYYQPGSLKAKLCVQGKEALYHYCEERGVEHKRLGKLIVASQDKDLATLEKLKRTAETNGIPDMVFLNGPEMKSLEPALAGVGALLSPSTGIVDSHGLMLAYQGEAEDLGMVIAFNSPFQSARSESNQFHIEVGGDTPLSLTANTLINSAGLGAQDIANNISGLKPNHIPKRYLLKGSYFSMTGKSPFTRLIYPVPPDASLGIHLTLDLGGQAKFGPDQEWIDSIDYTMNPSRADSFYASVRQYYPDLADGALEAAYSGIRPKIQAPGDPVADFMIEGPADHGIAGLVNLFGMESPGLTSSLAIGDYVCALLD
ncbi:MAG: NAD(P)/FAD-dependent oxidoreductase [Alphaproteobacteria bacterium]|jgi:L-2-hydroxyglutarate oxidase LhgO|nr:NAD(P)/FAD-dependent oxidoreductase [Alphaproteobacteria bacterium]MBT4019903.1 NAD(P)/FAD-dependent oxidoreductase [Alphaproteobacteria bacterium]MBT4965789.1 NAD(P)/FAD-dependent oxidoreductase [Alphaproteobacteria bacterium]MBT6385981.1 NAD(P)/FAD-dependent oxidoreductase [Alphaproteobacteria bacterium]MBT7747310.1 NAD(P)/FAD-dependent oxidoreductase [Alphaproteobacteria bacterium]